MSWYRWDGPDLIVNVLVQPRASRDALAGIHEDRLRIRITAPPIDGKANARLAAFLAECFRIAKGRVRLERGARGRAKVFRLSAPQHLPPELDIKPPAGR